MPYTAGCRQGRLGQRHKLFLPTSGSPPQSQGPCFSPHRSCHPGLAGKQKAVDAVPGSSRGKSPVFLFWGRRGFILSREAAAPRYLILPALAPDLVTGVLKFHEGKVTMCGGT